MSEAQASPTDLLYIDVFEVLRRRFPLIILGSVVGIGLALAYCFMARVQYESQAVVLVIPKESGLATTAGGGDIGMQNKVGEETLATHIQILTSPKVIKTALTTPLADGSVMLDLPSLQEKIPAMLKVDEASQRKGAVAYIKENLSVSRGGEGASKDAQVLRVRLQHTDPGDCMDLLNAMVSSYQQFLEDSVTNAGDEAGKLIEEASLELESTLNAQELAYREFLESAPMLYNNNGETLNPHQASVSKLETELSDLRLRTFDVRQRLKLTEAALADEVSNPVHRLAIFDGADVQRLSLLVQLDSESFDRNNPERVAAASVKYNELLQLQQDAQEDSLKVGPNHPRLQETNSKIAQIKDFLRDRNFSPEGSDHLEGVDLERLAALYHKALKYDLALLESREEELNTLIESETALSKKMIKVELEGDSLRRGRERTQSLYEAVVDRLREVNLAKDYGGYITELISAPNSGVKCWPKIPFLVALGSLLGVLGGAALAVVAELADKSFKDHTDIERELGYSVLAHIPKVRPQDLRGISKEGPVEPIVVALHKPKSRHSEAFRNLRTSIFFKTKDTETPIIQVTSPNAGDGKSTATANLAVSIAQTSKRVLLVECDMRRPTQHKVFGLPGGGNGMSSILQGTCSIEDAVQQCDGVPTLSIITAGEIPDNPAELLTLPDFNQFLEVVRDEYDFVLIDSPPVGPVSDPVSISSCVDHVLIAITLSKAARSAAMECRSKLVSNGANILGLVVNKFGGSERYGYSYGYGYGYGYGSESEYSEKNNAYYTY